MADTNNIDLSKIIANLKANASPSVRSALDSMTAPRELNTTYKTEINPVSYYTGNVPLYSDPSVPSSVSNAARSGASAQMMSKPLAVGDPNAIDAQGNKIVSTSPNSGRWAIDATDPNKLVYDPIHAERAANTPLTYQQKLDDFNLRGGLSSADVQIDHIMPVWLGGTDEVSNKRLYTTADHAQKTAVETVARELYYGKKVSLNEARELVINHTGKDVEGVKLASNNTSLEGGIVAAQKYYEAWKNPKPKLKDYWNEFTTDLFKKPVQSLEAAIGLPTTIAAAAILDPFLPEKARVNPIEAGMKYSQDVLAGKAGMSNTPIFGGFTQGVISGETLGWGKTYLPEYTGIDKTIAGVAGAAGNIAGTISNFLMLKGTAGIALKAAGIARGVEGMIAAQDVATAARSTKILTTLADMGLFAIQGQLSPQEEGVANARIKRLGADLANGLLMGTAGQTWKGYVNVGVGTSAISYIMGADPKDAVINGVTVMGLHSMGLPAKLKMTGELVAPVAKESVYDFAITGMNKKGGLSDPNKIILKERVVTKENAESLKQQFLQDAKNSTDPIAAAKSQEAAKSMDIIKKELPSKLSIGLKSFKSDKLVNAAAIDQKRATISATYRSELLADGKPTTDFTKPGAKPTATVKPKTKTPIEIHQENIAIRKKINENIANGVYTPEVGEGYYRRALVAGRELWKGTLPPAERAKQDALDLQSMADTTKNPANTTEASNFNSHEIPSPTAEYLSSQEARMQSSHIPGMDPLIGHNLPTELPSGTVPTGRHQLTGNAINEARGLTDTTALNNITRKEAELFGGADRGMNQQGNPVDTTIILSYRPDLAPIMRDINANLSPAEIARGESKPYTHPEHNIQASVKFADGSTGFVGWITRKSKIDGMKFSQNNRIRELNKQYQGTNRQPMQLLDVDVNKDSIGEVMSANGIHTMEVPAQIIRSEAVNSGQPYIIVNVTDQAWMNGVARNEGVMSSADRSTANLVSTLKQNDIPAAPVIRGMQVDPGEGSMINRSVVDLMAKITDDVETSFKTGNTDSLKKSLESDLGLSLTDEEIKKFVGKNGKVTRDLHNLVDDVISRNSDDLSDEARAIYSGVQILRADMEFMRTSAAMHDLPLNTTPIESPKAPTIIQEVSSNPKTISDRIAQGPAVTASTVEPMAATGEALPPKSVSVPSKPRWREFSLVGKEKEGVNSGILSYTQDPAILKTSTRKELTTLAKNVSSNGEDISGGWPKYKAEVESRIGAKITNPKELRDLEWSYKHLANSGTRKEFSGSGFQQGAIENIGEADRKISTYNKENGLAPDAMEVVGVSKSRDYIDDNGSPIFDGRKKFESDVKTLKSKGYVSIGITAKGSSNALYVKFEPKLAEKFDADPARYSNEGEKLTKPEDKFLRVMMVDVLGLPKETSYTDLVKRSNLIFHRYDRYSGSDASSKIKVHILKAKKISADASLTPKAEDFADPKDPIVKNSMDSFQAGATIDGKMVIGEKLYEKLIRDFNYDPNKFKTGFKPLISGDVTVDGKTMKMIQKGHAIKADPALRKMLKEEYGLDLGDNEIASFDTNAKIGAKEGTHEIDLGSIYSKPLTVGEEGRLMPSFETKLPAGDTKVNEDILAQTAERRKDFERFNEEIMASQNSEDISKVIDSVAERYGLDKDTLFYGVNGESFDLGASKINLSNNLEKISKNLFYETVLTDIAPNSGRAFMSPSFKLEIDGPGKPARYPRNDEVILGSQIMKAKNIKEGDEVLVLRDPSYDINNIIVAKAINGDRLGHTSLGTEHVAVSPFNERARLQGDQDGDTVLIMRVGEGGVPQSYADSIKANGSKVIPFTEVNASKPGYVTSEGIEKTISNQLVGDDQTSKIAMVNRAIGAIKSNKITVKVYPSGNAPRSKYKLISNGKVVETGETSKSKTGFTATPKWDYKEKQIRSQALQEAVDSKKSADIVKRTNNNDPNWMLQQVFVNDSGKNIDKFQSWSVNGALKNVQKSFNVGKISERSRTLNDVMKEMEPSFQLSRNIKAAGGELTPLQEKLLSTSDVKRLDIPDELIAKADELGAENVRKTITDTDPKDPILDKYKSLALSIKDRYHVKGLPKEERSKLRGSLEDYFLANKDSYTPQQIKDISAWAATSKLANLSHGLRPVNPGDVSRTHYPTSKFIMRYKRLITANPEVARAYYEGSEAATKTDVQPLESQFSVEEQ